MSNSSPPQHHRKKWAKFLIRWTIAVVGIGWVLWKTPLYNSVLIVGPGTVLFQSVAPGDSGMNGTITVVSP